MGQIRVAGGLQLAVSVLRLDALSARGVVRVELAFGGHFSAIVAGR